MKKYCKLTAIVCILFIMSGCGLQSYVFVPYKVGDEPINEEVVDAVAVDTPAPAPETTKSTENSKNTTTSSSSATKKETSSSTSTYSRKPSVPQDTSSTPTDPTPTDPTPTDPT
jgi:cytoskeletal protein RodZ